MAFKETKRKGFNFFRSYYDVYNELESDSDKIAFIDALLDRQFLFVKPTNLKGMAKFAYISQINSIDSQVKGYEDKMKGLKNDILTPTEPPTQGVKKNILTPTAQVQVKGEVKEQEQYVYFNQETFVNWFNECRKHIGLPSNIKKLSRTEQNYFSEIQSIYTIGDFKQAFKGFSNDAYFKSNNMLFPIHFLKEENFTKFLNAKELTLGEKLAGKC